MGEGKAACEHAGGRACVRACKRAWARLHAWPSPIIPPARARRHLKAISTSRQPPLPPRALPAALKLAREAGSSELPHIILPLAACSAIVLSACAQVLRWCCCVLQRFFFCRFCQ